MRIGIVCPYSFDVPGRRAEPRAGPGRDADRARPRGQRARAGRRGRAAAAVRGAGRPGGAGAVQRLGGPAHVRPGLRRPGAALAGRAASSTCCTCTSRSRRACRCWRCSSARGPVVATFHTAMTRSRALPPAQGVLQLVLEKITARIAVSELARKVQVEHLGGGAVEIPNGVAVARFAAAAPLPGWPGEGGRARLPGPVHRAAQGLPVLLRRRSSTLAPRSGPGCGCWWPARATATSCTTTCPADLRDRIDVPGHGLRGGQGADAAQRRRLRGAEHRRRVVRHDPHRGDGGRHRRCVASDLDAFRRVLDGGRAGALFPTGDAAALADAAGRAAGRPGARGPQLVERAPATVVAAYDWPVVAAPGAGGLRDRDRGHRRPGARRRVGRTTSAARDVSGVDPALRCPACGGSSVWSLVVARAVDVPDLDRPAGRPGARPGGRAPAGRWTRTCCAAPRRPPCVAEAAPTRAELYAAARLALDAEPDEREAAENDLTRQLQTLPPDRRPRRGDPDVDRGQPPAWRWPGRCTPTWSATR